MRALLKTHVPPNIFTYSSLLSAYTGAGHLNHANSLFAWMLQQADPLLQPTTVAYTTLINGSTSCMPPLQETFFFLFSTGHAKGSWMQAARLHQDMARLGVPTL
jgi:hypothetical protein